MAKVLIGSDIGSYSFNKTAKTITFSGFVASLERILLVTDTTNNTIIYQFNDATKGGTLSNNILTLTYDTTGGTFANTDKLQIFYWSEDPQQVGLMDVAMALKKTNMLLERPAYMTPTGFLKVDLLTSSAGTSIGSSGTLPVTTSGTLSVNLNAGFNTIGSINNITGSLNSMGAASLDQSFNLWLQFRESVNQLIQSRIVTT